MKNLNLLIGLLVGLVILSSCSKDDDPDMIIGKWRAIEKYESQVQVDLALCDPHFYTDYRADNLIILNRIETDDFPEKCYSIGSEIGMA